MDATGRRWFRESGWTGKLQIIPEIAGGLRFAPIILHSMRCIIKLPKQFVLDSEIGVLFSF
jgi:hypothetical protein